MILVDSGPIIAAAIEDDGTTDASVIVIAERLSITEVATLDRRRFPSDHVARLTPCTELPSNFAVSGAVPPQGPSTHLGVIADRSQFSLHAQQRLDDIGLAAAIQAADRHRDTERVDRGASERQDDAKAPHA